MTHLWARAILRNRIVRSEAIPLDTDVTEALGELCRRMDLPRPMILGKHEREWEQFGHTVFGGDHFVESIPYDRLEVERIDPDARKTRSQDPRNG